ncbi:MAG: diguanylate cyclase domain-containing protein, partial [Acetobacteraceae bacterium]
RLLVGRVTHVPLIVAAVPLPPAHPGGPPAGVLAASLDLFWLSHRAALTRLPRGAVALVLDSRTGSVIAHFPRPGAWIGRRLPEGRLAAALHAGRNGTFDGRGPAGTERIFGLARLPGGSGGPFVMVVGLARSAVLGSALRQEALALTVALLTGFLTLLLAWLIVEFSILRPIHALADTAIRIGRGDHVARPPPLAVTAPEFRTLGIRLADMAERLERAGVALRESEAHYRLLAENTTDVIIRLGPDLERLYVSPVCEELFGYTAAEMLARSFREDVLAEDAEMAATLVRGLDASHPQVSLQERFRRKDGRVIWVESNIRWLDDERGYVVSLRDISGRKTIESELEAANQRLELLAWQDSLTGLGNRRAFDRRLDHEYRRAHRSGAPLALILIDVDRFKHFNDMYGHPAGDDCLRAVAGAVDSVLRRPADHGARYGGEEIAMLLPETDEAGAVLLAERVCATVRALGIEHAGNEGGIVTVSAGVAAILPGDGADTASGLVRAADRALYAAKSVG